MGNVSVSERELERFAREAFERGRARGHRQGRDHAKSDLLAHAAEICAILEKGQRRRIDKQMTTVHTAAVGQWDRAPEADGYDDDDEEHEEYEEGEEDFYDDGLGHARPGAREIVLQALHDAMADADGYDPTPHLAALGVPESESSVMAAGARAASAGDLAALAQLAVTLRDSPASLSPEAAAAVVASMGRLTATFLAQFRTALQPPAKRAKRFSMSEYEKARRVSVARKAVSAALIAAHQGEPLDLGRFIVGELGVVGKVLDRDPRATGRRMLERIESARGAQCPQTYAAFVAALGHFSIGELRQFANTLDRIGGSS